MRIATIDLGTNTILLLIAERNAAGETVALRQEMRIVRLGEGVDKTRRFADAAVARTVAAVSEFGKIAKEYGVNRTIAVGTSAMRDAAGGEPIRAAFLAHFGTDVDVISGEREALVTFRGALSGLPLSLLSDPIAVFDIGGGSTEVVLGDLAGTVQYAQSFDVGSVRLTERHLRPASSATPEEVAHLRQVIAQEFSPLRGPLFAQARAAFGGPSGAVPVGIAGTVTTLVAIDAALEPYDGARVHGASLTRQQVAQCIERLAPLTPAERATIPGLDAKRADVILAGALIVREILDALGAPGLVASDRGVRWGLAEEALSA